MTETTKKTRRTKEQILGDMVKKHEEMTNKSEQKLVEYALKHNLYLSLGEYGGGRTLLLENNHWSGKDRGEWLYSSETC